MAYTSRSTIFWIYKQQTVYLWPILKINISISYLQSQSVNKQKETNKTNPCWSLASFLKLKYWIGNELWRDNIFTFIGSSMRGMLAQMTSPSNHVLNRPIPIVGVLDGTQAGNNSVIQEAPYRKSGTWSRKSLQWKTLQHTTSQTGRRHSHQYVSS